MVKKYRVGVTSMNDEGDKRVGEQLDETKVILTARETGVTGVRVYEE